MSEAHDALQRIDALVQIALRLAGTAAGGRIALAKLAANLDRSWLPEPWDASIWPALDRAAGVPSEEISFATVEQILRDAWGVRRVTDELDSIDSDPAAVGPTSQVHRGVRHGKPVAVKVLRPGLAASVRQDLLLLDGLLAPLAGAFPGINPGALLGEIRERVMDEFDLENEASVQRRFHRGLRRGAGGPTGVVVPEPVGDLSREQVLVSEWIDGTPLPGAVTVDHDAVAAQLLRFVIGGIREGMIHCDLDDDDVLVLADGRLAVLDYGAVAMVPRARADACLAVVRAFADADGAALGTSLAELGLLEAALGGVALEVATTTLAELGGGEPTRLDADAVAACLPRLRSCGDDAVKVLLAGRLEPSDVYPARGIGQLLSVIARFGATGAWRTLIAEALSQGWT